jgi:hypothetical protein
MKILEQNLKKLGIQECLKDVIMDSYSYSFIRIRKTSEVFIPVDIVKGMKRGCLLSQLFLISVIIHCLHLSKEKRIIITSIQPIKFKLILFTLCRPCCFSFQ